jgi:hypothetical protein
MKQERPLTHAILYAHLSICRNLTRGNRLNVVTHDLNTQDLTLLV